MNDLRIRHISNITPHTDNIQHWTDWDCNPAVMADTLSSRPTGTYATMTDYVVPNYHKRVAKGEVFFNPMTRQVDTCTESGTWWKVRRSTPTILCNGVYKYSRTWYEGSRLSLKIGTPDLITGMIYGNPCIDPDDIKSAKSEASTRVLSQRGRSRNNLFESLAEFDQTLGQLNAIARAANNVLHGRFRLPRSAKFIKNKASDEYLGWRYGLRPLINDIESVMEGLRASIKNETQRIASRASIPLSASRTETFTIDTAGPCMTYIDNICEDKVTIRAMSLDEMVITRAHELGFSFKGLVTTPIELISYEFVAGWFANFSEYLGSFVPDVGLHNLGSCLVENRTTLNTWETASAVAVGDYVLERAPGAFMSHERKSKIRSGLLSPRIVIKNDFRFNTVTRVADAFALLAQKMR